MVAAHDFANGSAERPWLQLGTAQLRAILVAEAEERDELARQMTALGKADRASALTAEAGIIRRYIDR